MNIELIIIGNELLNGKIQDLNSHYLGQKLFQENHQLQKVQIIGDNPDQFNQALSSALEESDVVIFTGGLGPTRDDLTKKMLADYFEKEIVFNEKALEVSMAHYKRGERKYNKSKIDYHNLPLEFSPLHNPVGYAPGIFYQDKKKFIFATPGVPSEFQAMLNEEILPRLSTPDEISKHVIIKTWKLPEAYIFHKTAPQLWSQLNPIGEVSSLPHLIGVDIGVRVTGTTQAEIDIKEQKVLEVIDQSPLKEFVWHIGPESVEEVIVQKASDKNLTIGFSESCTGGLCASRITDVSGSSQVFWGSVVSYANEVKMKSLYVSDQTLKDHGAVSKETAYEMAKGAREHLGVDIAVSTTGVAGPNGGSKEKPVGTVGIGISTKEKTSSEIYHFKGDRVTLKKRFSFMALFLLLEEIEKH